MSLKLLFLKNFEWIFEFCKYFLYFLMSYQLIIPYWGQVSDAANKS